MSSGNLLDTPACAELFAYDGPVWSNTASLSQYSPYEVEDEALAQEEQKALSEYLGGSDSTGTVPKAGHWEVRENEFPEDLIWKITSEYLSNVQCVVERQEAKGGLGSTEVASSVQDYTLLALQTFMTSHIPAHHKSRRGPAASELHSFLPRLKGKTGRKPQNYECFKCHSHWPYKRELIHHLRQAHDIHRSQSLLYKRLNQDPSLMRRLYGSR